MIKKISKSVFLTLIGSTELSADESDLILPDDFNFIDFSDMEDSNSESLARPFTLNEE